MAAVWDFFLLKRALHNRRRLHTVVQCNHALAATLETILFIESEFVKYCTSLIKPVTLESSGTGSVLIGFKAVQMSGSKTPVTGLSHMFLS